MKIEKTTEGFVLITELSTAKEMCLFDRVTHEHSEYSTDYLISMVLSIHIH